MTHLVQYSQVPILSWEADVGIWVTQHEFRVSWTSEDKQLIAFYVAAGFRTDLASIPVFLRSLIPQVGRHLQAAIVHDWCYAGNTILKRKESDLLFLDGMIDSNVSWLRRNLIYAAVRTNGNAYWRGNI